MRVIDGVRYSKMPRGNMTLKTYLQRRAEKDRERGKLRRQRRARLRGMKGTILVGDTLFDISRTGIRRKARWMSRDRMDRRARDLKAAKKAKR